MDAVSLKQGYALRKSIPFLGVFQENPHDGRGFKTKYIFKSNHRPERWMQPKIISRAGYFSILQKCNFRSIRERSRIIRNLEYNLLRKAEIIQTTENPIGTYDRKRHLDEVEGK
ncbi:hypothetical protein AVEN_270740-1 [Araneus ventricosus]|uniref:Uncharacterized protein n=1 Tax=Araneus ventricosus TaxID=182803 RepID=A0A4Y2KR03_ARAVE|nr:hypothetical protein AVEN_270740-1 [Araneus ventricosus]